MAARGLSTEGQTADGTECLDCIQTHQDQARASLERDRKMEAEFAEVGSEAVARAHRLELTVTRRIRSRFYWIRVRFEHNP